MATIHVIHALPNSFLPNHGDRLTVVGLSQSEAASLSQRHSIKSHVRYPETADRLSQILGVGVPAVADNCPSPFDINEGILLASLQPGSTDFRFCLIYNGNVEWADYEWRHSMTWGA